MSTRRYTLLRRLGEGAFGAVYLVDYQTAGGFRRRCAIKLLHPTWDPESDAVVRLRDEARLLGRLQHPNIVRVDDLIQLDGRWGVVMEAIRGENLEQVINRRAESGEPLPLSVVTATLVGVVAAIRAAAGMRDDDGRPAPVVHRDIKPSNILMSDAGVVKVLDFGVARAAFEGREARTGQLVYGSLGYMAPERFVGDPDGTASDLYSIGVVGFELLLLRSLGRCPLKVAAHVQELDRVRDEVTLAYGQASAGLRDLLREMVRYSADERPSVETVHARLVELARATGGPALDEWASANLRIPPEPDATATGGVVLEDGAPAELVSPLPTRTSALPPRLPMSSPTVVPHLSAFALEAVEPVPVPVPARRSRTWMAGAALLFVALAAIIWVATRPEPEPPAVAAPEPPPPVAAPVAPVAAPAPAAPVPAPVPAPAAPRPVVTPRAAPTPPPTAASDPPAPAVSGPRLRSVKVALAGGGAISVRCGDVSQDGTDNVLLRNVPAGRCLASASGARGEFTVDAPAGITCTPEGAGLACR